jgi:hypothetical protein
MSIESWKKKYYPIPAGATKGTGLKAILDHSIKKWKGFRLKNLHKHGLTTHDTAIVELNSYQEEMMSPRQCSLCVSFRKQDCIACPIVEVTGDTCDPFDLVNRSPWDDMVSKQDPEPMIKLLKRVRRETLEK